MISKPSARPGLRRLVLAPLAGSLLVGATAVAAEPQPDPGIERLRQLSLDDLLNLEVSTVSKNERRLGDTAAAVTVLTAEDLRRSGVTQVPEALRLVPGVQVARLSAHQWAISVRGFNEVFANKLLVMVDGRSVYTPLFSGTLWEFQDLPIESIDRIEVVRGPGGSVWGANAVNGVINIITKSAREVHGGHFSVGGGNLDQFIATTSLGTPISDEASIRLDANYRSHADMETPTGDPNNDSFISATGRLRLDWEPAAGSTFMIAVGGQYAEFDERADLLDLSLPAYVTSDYHIPAHNAHLLGRWSRVVDETSEIDVQTYFDFSRIDSPWLQENRFNFDVELNHRWRPGGEHGLSWGLGYRLSSDDITTSGDTISVAPAERSVNLFSGFLQDEWEVRPEVLSLTAGVRLEHNDYTGFEIQPTLRGLWKVAEQHSTWLAASRAVRTPSRAENDATVNVGLQPPGTVHPLLPAVVAYTGSDAFEPEDLWAFEFGYRWQPGERLHLDLASFFNLYERLRGSERGLPYPNDPLAPTYLIVPLLAANNTSGNTYGAELSVFWQATARWQWRLGYSYLGIDMSGPEASDLEGWSPDHQAFLQSRSQLTDTIELDVTLRFVGDLPGPDIPSYFTGDVRLGWRPRENLELSVVGQNLFDSPHQEFASSLIDYHPSVISRAVFGKLTWSF